MSHLLFLFLDGVGLGEPDPARNPFFAARTPVLDALLEGKRLVAGVPPFEGHLATLLEIDTQLGVPGTPQSASGQAVLLTGLNVPRLIGSHYGPKPNEAIRRILAQGNLFSEVVRSGGRAALLNAYPPRYFDFINSRRRLYSSIPFAATAAGLPLMTAEDLQERRALAPDFTAAGWAAQPDFPPAPVYEPLQAGEVLASLCREYDLAWFDGWPTDYAGHRGTMAQAVGLVETIDWVLGGLVQSWGDRDGLIVLTSDHGNLEDLAKRGHTMNSVPGLLIGPRPLRAAFAAGLKDLTGFAPAIRRLLGLPQKPA